MCLINREAEKGGREGVPFLRSAGRGHEAPAHHLAVKKKGAQIQLIGGSYYSLGEREREKRKALFQFPRKKGESLGKLIRSPPRYE